MSEYSALTPYLRVADLGKSLAFYTRALGFSVALLLEDGGVPYFARVRAGDASLMLGDRPVRYLPHGEEEEHRHGQWRDATHLNPGVDINLVTYLSCGDVDAAYRRVLDAGYATVDAPEDRPYGAREFLLTDPDGYYLAISQPL